MKMPIAGICLLLSLTAFTAGAAESGSQAAITESLARVLPGVTPDQIKPSPMQGVSEVLVGPRLFYISDDGRYLLQGSLIDLETRKDISEERRKDIRLDAINKVGADNMIVFPAEEERHTITVFTDIDCGYCRKLHKEVKQFNAEGITVRYLMFPRSGINSPSYDKAVSVWCADDRREALTQAKAGKEITPRKCDNPVSEQYELGNLLGVSGTPALILDNGELLPGYVPAKRLAQALDGHG
ncbi:MAG TPA: bifunctional protein-disulfide isomerase/oxidoreductase DsbC [Gammaproteobacteria bacterium]|nr:bifunctional protein-disulfide isomerase/oxidoreductase DsbC [Gammaproteobacteria bacterium]